MKQFVKITLPLILIVIIVSPTPASAAYNVSVGESFTYDVLQAYLEATRGSDSASGNGFGVAGHQFGSNTPITYEITAVDSFGVNGTLSSGNYSETWFCSTLEDIIRFEFLLTYPVFMGMQLFMGPFNPSHYEGGLGLISFFVVVDSSFYEILEAMDNETYLSEFTTQKTMEDFQVDASYKEEGDNIDFEWYMEGSYSTMLSASYSISINWDLRLVFQKSSGVLLGARCLGFAEGNYGIENFKVVMDSHIEQTGYDLPTSPPNNGGFILGLEWLIPLGVVGALVIVGGVFLIIRRFKK